MSAAWKIAACGFGAVILVGCASTNPQPAFADVQKAITDRSGQKAEWFRDEAFTSKVEQTIAALLQTNLTAQSAVQIAFLANPRVQALFEEIGISRAEWMEASLLPNPEFSGSWRFPRGAGVLNQEYSVAGNLIELLTLPLRKKIASQSLEATKLRIVHEVLKLNAEVQRAFYTVQATQQLLKRLVLIAELNEAAADIAKRRQDAGNITDLELAEQQALYAQSKVNVAQAEARGRSDREQLNRLMGAWGSRTQWTLADELPGIPETEVALERLETLAIRQRQDLAAARGQLTLLAEAVSRQSRLRYLPVARVGADAERDPDGQWVVGPTVDLALPIFNQGQGQLARLAAQYRQARREFEALAIDIRSEVRQARDLLIANRDRAQYYGKTLLPLRLRIVNRMQLQYNAMQKGPADLLLAKERELDAEREYVEAWRDYWTARVDLEKALGGKLTSEGHSDSSKSSPAPSTDHTHHH